MYGWRVRIGHVAPSRGDTLVYEFYQMLPAGFMILNRNESPDGTVKKELKFHFYVTLLNLGSIGGRYPFMNL